MSHITPEKIESAVRSFGSDSLKVVGGDFEGGIHLQQVPDEISHCISDLLKLQDQKVIKGIKSFLEIGSAAGGNAFIFNHWFDIERTVIIDDNKHPKHIHRPQTLSHIEYHEFIGDSHSEEAVEFLKGLGYAYDLLFIDGDHSYEGVKQDAETYSKFVNYQGFIIFHDTVACSGIKKYVLEAREDPKLDLQFIRSYESKTHESPCGITVFRSFNLPYYRTLRKEPS